MSAATLDTLEVRLAELERRVLGDDRWRPLDRAATDLLLEASRSASAALSGRERINSTWARSAELERYLDPTFEDRLDASATVEAAISCGPELRRCLDRLGRLEELSPALDSPAIAAVETHRGRLDLLRLAGLEANELTDECCRRVYSLVEEYNAIVVNITKTLVQWDNLVTQVELERKPKKLVE